MLKIITNILHHIGKQFLKAILTVAFSFFLVFSSSAQTTSTRGNFKDYIRKIAKEESNREANKVIDTDEKRLPKSYYDFTNLVIDGQYNADVKGDLASLQKRLRDSIADGGIVISTIEEAGDAGTKAVNDAYRAYEKAKESGVGLKEAEDEFRKAYPMRDVLKEDAKYPNGFNDILVRNFATQNAIKRATGAQGGVETGAFMDGYVFATLNLHNVIIPSAESSGDMGKDFQKAKEILANMPKDKVLTFFPNSPLETKMSINQALALMERATDGKDDADISQREALLAGALVSMYYQQETNTTYNGVIPEALR